MNLSAKDSNFNQDESVLTWGTGGEQHKDHYGLKHFTQVIWLTSAHAGQYPKGSKPIYVNAKILKSSDTQTMLIWNMKYEGTNTNPINITGKMVLGGAISDITLIEIVGEASFTSGHVTMESW